MAIGPALIDAGQHHPLSFFSEHIGLSAQAVSIAPAPLRCLEGEPQSRPVWDCGSDSEVAAMLDEPSGEALRGCSASTGGAD